MLIKMLLKLYVPTMPNKHIINLSDKIESY